jgi:hypothetical protein
MTCQNGVLKSLAYRRAVLKQQIPNTLCFPCKIQSEMQMHLLLACHSYAGSVHMNWHNVALQVT